MQVENYQNSRLRLACVCGLQDSVEANCLVLFFSVIELSWSEFCSKGKKCSLSYTQECNKVRIQTENSMEYSGTLNAIKT